MPHCPAKSARRQKTPANNKTPSARIIEPARVFSIVRALFFICALEKRVPMSSLQKNAADILKSADKAFACYNLACIEMPLRLLAQPRGVTETLVFKESFSMLNTSTPTRVCKKCKRVLPYTSDFFCRDKNFKNGLRARCKDCNAADRAVSLKGTWKGMIARCHEPRSSSYRNYGAKGIQVCDEWRKSYDAFVRDMGERPKGCTLDRIDPAKDYTPENCRWADLKTQGENRRNVKKIEFQGRTQTPASWAAEYGLTKATLKSRLDLGWPLEKALTTPVRETHFNHGHIINLEYDGKTQSVEDWARELGVCAGTLRWRVRRGWSVERVLLTAIKQCGRRK